MALGSLVDCLLLTPTEVTNEFIVLPEDAPRKPTQAQINAKKKSDVAQKSIMFWHDFEIKAAGKTIVSRAEMKTAMAGVKQIQSNERIKDLLDNSKTQTVVVAEYNGFLVKGMLDILPNEKTEFDDFIFDLKRTSAYNPKDFKGIIRAFKYHQQAGGYRWLMRQNGVDRPRWGFIISDAEPPHLAGMVELSQKDIQLGEDQFLRDLNKYIECVENEHFPTPYEGDEILNVFTY